MSVIILSVFCQRFRCECVHINDIVTLKRSQRMNAIIHTARKAVYHVGHRDRISFFRLSDSSFAVDGPRVWNRLSASLCLVDSYTCFSVCRRQIYLGDAAARSDCLFLGAVYKFSYLLTYLCSVVVYAVPGKQEVVAEKTFGAAEHADAANPHRRVEGWVRGRIRVGLDVGQRQWTRLVRRHRGHVGAAVAAHARYVLTYRAMKPMRWNDNLRCKIFVGYVSYA